MRAYRVTIEAIDETGTVDQRVEIRQDFADDEDWSRSLAIACAGAINGVCVFDDPSADTVAGIMLWRMALDCDLLNATGWLCNYKDRHGDERMIDQVAAVVVRKDFVTDPLHGYSVDELPEEIAIADEERDALTARPEGSR